MTEIEMPINQISDDIKTKAAYALNLCTVSLTQIADYSDPYILEQEYDAILNNLNIQNIIHDETLLKLFKKMMATLTFYRIQEGDKKFIEQEYQDNMRNALWSAIPSPAMLFVAGGEPISTAILLSSQIGTGYINYRKQKHTNARAKEKQEWELKRGLIEEVGVLQRELFETTWKLSATYNFDDKYRLTEKQIRNYSAILMDVDPISRYERLDAQQDTFQAFPPFWYYKGNAAKEIAETYSDRQDLVDLYKAKSLEDYRKFDSIYIELMREDVIAASCALEHIAMLDKNRDAQEIKKLLDRTAKLAGNNFDILQIAMFAYLSIGENEKAKSLLRRLVNERYNLGVNGLLLSRMYFKLDKNKAEFDLLEKRIGKNNVIPWIENDTEADKKYLEITSQEVYPMFERFLETFLTRSKPYLQMAGIDNTVTLIANTIIANTIDDYDFNNDISDIYSRTLFVLWAVFCDNFTAYNNFTANLFDFEVSKEDVENENTEAIESSWSNYFNERLGYKIKKLKSLEVSLENVIREIIKKSKKEGADRRAWIGGGIGLILGGPVGAGIGAAIGAKTKGLSNDENKLIEEISKRKEFVAFTHALDFENFTAEYITFVKNNIQKILSEEIKTSMSLTRAGNIINKMTDEMNAVFSSWEKRLQDNGEDVNENSQEEEDEE